MGVFWFWFWFFLSLLLPLCLLLSVQIGHFIKQKNVSLLKKQTRKQNQKLFTLSIEEKLNFTAKRWISWCKIVVQLTMSVDELYCAALGVMLKEGRAQLTGLPKYRGLKGKVNIEFSIFIASICHLIVTRHILVV